MKELLRKEITLQWRQGFWLVYFIVAAIYILVLLNLPREQRMMVSLVMILTDTSVLGVLFIGALVLLEKQQSVIPSLFVTPLSPGAYIWSKSLSLSLIAVCMSIGIYLPVWQLSLFSPFLLLGITLTALSYTMLGLGIAASVERINAYFGTQMLYSVVMALPIVPYLLLNRHPLFLALPYIPSLDFMLAATKAIPLWRILLDVLLMCFWAFAAYRFALHRVRKYMIYR